MGLEKTEVMESSSPDVVKSGKFLPRMVLRVLLVEADDSTRQIIAALLRKCSYRVAAVPDGLKAWETLKGRPNDIDLILTEVELPSISGYALLTLIMEHNICKNIPVIMMSSQDSISVVLKCMLRGAADFLIKPVRRNELRNLWQHVWRRQTNCQQTIGRVPKNTAVEQQKVEVTFKNNAASSHSSDHLDSTPKSKECCKKGSDAQSSCITPCLEAESACMQNMQGVSQLKYGTDSKLSNTEKHEDYMKLVERSVMPKIETGGKSIRIEPENISCNEAYKSTAFCLGNDPVCARTVTWDSDSGLESQRGHANNKLEIHRNADDVDEPSSEALDLIGKFGHHLKDTNGNLTANDGTNKFSFAPELELSLRRFRPSCPKNKATDEGDILNHSNASAFSRYNNNKALRSLFPALTSNCRELMDYAATFHDGVSYHRAEKTIGSLSYGAALSSQESMSTVFTGQSGHSEDAIQAHQRGFIPIAGYDQIFPPILYTQSGFPPLWSPIDQQQQSSFPVSSSHFSSSEIINSERSYHPCEETTNPSAEQTVGEEVDDSKTMESLVHGSPTPGLSDIGSLYNGIANKLNSGASEDMCNESDGPTTPVGAAVRTRVSESVNDNHFLIHGSVGGTDSHCSSLREAALIKFRMKRKDRCYEKKVRYQSRKRLAEQRPRVKGQFVRQAQIDPACPEF